MSWYKCPGVPRGQSPGMAADKCIKRVSIERGLTVHLLYACNENMPVLHGTPLILNLILTRLKRPDIAGGWGLECPNIKDKEDCSEGERHSFAYQTKNYYLTPENFESLKSWS